jgi:hypothetical protein
MTGPARERQRVQTGISKLMNLQGRQMGLGAQAQQGRHAVRREQQERQGTIWAEREGEGEGEQSKAEQKSGRSDRLETPKIGQDERGKDRQDSQGQVGQVEAGRGRGGVVEGVTGELVE